MAITVKHTKVSTIPDGDDTSVVRPSDWNADHQLVGTVPVSNGGTGAATLTGYVIGNGTGAMTASTTIPNTAITGLGTASTKDAGVANGVATLDGSGTVPISQLPAAVLGALSYQGTWNATTNTPTLTSSVGTKGYYYVVSVAGTTNLNGITDWQVGDWAVYNGTAWQKIDNTDAVTSVNGYTGTVVLNATDVGAVSSVSGTAPVSVATGTTTPVISLASGYGDTQNPYASKTAKYVLAAPNATAGVPTFRQLANTDISGLGTMSTQNASSVAITGGTLNGVAIGGTTAGDGTFDILTANVSRLGNSTATYYQASNGLVSTGTYTATPPSDGLVIDYATGFGRFSDFGGDGFQWYNAGVATTKLMELSSTGALATTGTVTANGVLLTGNLGTVTSVAATAGTGISVSGSPITTSGTLTITNTAPDQTVAISSGTGISVTGTYPNFTVTNTAPSSGGTVTSVSGTTGRITSTGGTTPVIDLASGIATAGTTGSATLIPVITIDTYGRVTSITTASNPQGTVTSVGGTGTVNGLTLTGTVTSSGNLTLGGTLDLSSPPAIGGTTPAAITGTTITATKFVGVSGGTF